MNIHPAPIVVFVTSPKHDAKRIANDLIQHRLAACVNIVDHIESIYAWKGEVCEASESLLIIKTIETRFEALRIRVVEIHPYDVPEVISIPIQSGHAAYLEWIGDSTSSTPSAAPLSS